MSVLAFPLLLAVSSLAPPPKPAKLGLCVSCHGEDGRARTALAPHIGGQNEAYLAAALSQYRDGRRADQVMRGVAGTLSAADIDSLAAWYAHQVWPAAAPLQQP